MSPAASWCAKQHCLRWLLPVIAAGQAADLKVQFSAHVGDDPLRSEGVLAGVTGALPVGCPYCYGIIGVGARGAADGGSVDCERLAY